MHTPSPRFGQASKPCEEKPKPATGEKKPEPAAGEEQPKPAAGEQKPKPGAGEQNSKPAAGEEQPKPVARGEQPKPAAGEEQPEPASRRASKPAVVQEVVASPIGVRSKIINLPGLVALDQRRAHYPTRFVHLDVVWEQVLHESHRVRSPRKHGGFRCGLPIFYYLFLLLKLMLLG